jgi:protein-disulfide isomerase
MTARWLARVRWPSVLFRLLTLVGLGVSSALVADYVFEVGSFCSPNDPCAEVAASDYGEVLGVPLAVVGIIGFAVLLALSLVPTRWAAVAVRALAVVAGLAGLTLLVIQLAVLRQVCPYCVVADLSAVGLGIVAVVTRPFAEPPTGVWLWVGVLGWLWAGLIVGLAPIAWEAAHLPVAAPEPIRAHWASGKITMVQVTDFDCPSCQRAHPIVVDWRRQHPDVRFVLLVAPIPGHHDAWPAAEAYAAAVRQGKGEEMADALYTAPARDPKTCRQLAERIGLNLEAYDKVVADRGTMAEFEAINEWVRPLQLGQPFFWIQDELVAGVPTAEKLDAALARARPAP